MFGNLIALVVLIALAVFFAWLVRRAWRLKRWYLRWPALVLSGVLTLLLVLIVVLDARGLSMIYATYPVVEAHVAIAGTPEQVARGEHLAAVMCGTCHSTNLQLPLSGGPNLSDDAGLPLGDLYAPNITSAGVIKNLSDDEIWRILRTGIDPHGRITMMAGVPASRLSDDDAKAVIAYLRRAPGVEKQTPAISISPLLAVLAGAGLIQLSAPAAIQPVSAPPKAVSREYGDYIVSLLDCRGCHGPKLDGNAPPPSPPGRRTWRSSGRNGRRTSSSRRCARASIRRGIRSVRRCRGSRSACWTIRSWRRCTSICMA